MNACTWISGVLFVPLILNQDYGFVKCPLTPWEQSDLHKEFSHAKHLTDYLVTPTPLVGLSTSSLRSELEI